MTARRKLSLVEEFGPVVERLGIEKEDVIQSCIFLIREEGAEEITEELDWDVTSTSVGSAKISILIDQLMDFGLLEFLSNKGYILTGKGRKLLLNTIPEDLKKKYSDYIESIILKDKDEIVKSAREIYLEKDKLRYNV